PAQCLPPHPDDAPTHPPSFPTRRSSDLCGYVNPDETTVEYIRGRPFAPQGAEFDKAANWWLSLASGPDATYDDEVRFSADQIEPDRKSTRLNSSHVKISYAVFCLKKKKG